MSVRIYEFQEGLRLPNGESGQDHLARLAVRCAGEAVPIEPGEYDFTPLTWESNPVQQRLLVHDEHLATFQHLTRTTSPVWSMVLGGDQLTVEDAAVRDYTLIPEETTFTGILAPSTDGYGQDVWAIIYSSRDC